MTECCLLCVCAIYNTHTISSRLALLVFCNASKDEKHPDKIEHHSAKVLLASEVIKFGQAE